MEYVQVNRRSSLWKPENFILFSYSEKECIFKAKLFSYANYASMLELNSWMTNESTSPFWKALGVNDVSWRLTFPYSPIPR